MRLFKKKRSSIGYLVFDASIPGEAPYLAVDRASDLDVIAESDYVTLKVVRTKGGSLK